MIVVPTLIRSAIQGITRSPFAARETQRLNPTRELFIIALGILRFHLHYSACMYDRLLVIAHKTLCCAVDVQRSSVRFLGSLVLNLWDCGGQDAFYENYFNSQRDHTFRDVAVLIYVFDAQSADIEVCCQTYSLDLHTLAHFGKQSITLA
jgi:hypothetical protein